jgi:hypothetical protein
MSNGSRAEVGYSISIVLCFAFRGGGSRYLFAGRMNRTAILGVDVGKNRGFGKLDGLKGGRLWEWVGSSLGPAATVTTRFFFSGILHHSH